MVNSGLIIKLFDFREQVVLKSPDLTAKQTSKQMVVMKAPAGSGKTIIFIDYVDEHPTNVNNNTAFIWLCLGKGNLEEQSQDKVQKTASHCTIQNLSDSLLNGSIPGSTTFINWELVTEKGNTAIRDSERKNPFERIADAHRNGVEFTVIIDEERSNNTVKTKVIIGVFAAKNIIRVSTTATESERYESFETDEIDVIDAGLITKTLYINEGISDNLEIADDYDHPLDPAGAKRKDIAKRYQEIGKNIRPLALTQFPNGQPETIFAVEQKLESMGYAYNNGMASKWMSEDKKDLPGNLTGNDGIPVFLLMKQAISTGWDCPRVKILVKLREGMSESFEIQTIGRIRRMSEAIHYEDDLLDFCYAYISDEKYKAGLLADMDKAYETCRLFLKDKCKTFTLEKEICDQNFDGLGECEVLNKIYEALVKKYGLSGDKANNKIRFMAAGYQFGDEIIGHTLYGQYIRTDTAMENHNYYTTRERISMHKHDMDLLHYVDSIKSAIGMATAKVKTILERLFRKGGNSYRKLLSLDTTKFHAFIINNGHKLKEEFREVTSDMVVQMSLTPHPKKSRFHTPEQDFFRYDSGAKSEAEYLSNAYYEYTSGYVTSLVRSTSETLFEQYRENQSDIEWAYKNGDAGQQYFSIIYIDALQHQWLFYVDYIVMKKDGIVWVIETRGGGSKGQGKNTDKRTENKFNAFKKYVEEKGLHQGFVRDKDSQLYINNTVFSKNMSGEHWIPPKQEFWRSQRAI